MARSSDTLPQLNSINAFIKLSKRAAIGVGLEFDGGFQQEDGLSLTPGLYGTITLGFDFRIGPSIGFGDRSDERRLRATLLFQF
ncbi:MAG: hypothetical protein V3U69_03925 [Bacteroidota bacterium]